MIKCFEEKGETTDWDNNRDIQTSNTAPDIVIINTYICYICSCITHWATSIFLFLWQLKADQASSHWILTSCKSSMNIVYHILHGWPLFFFPLGSIKVIVILGRWWFNMCSMWPARCILNSLTVSSSLCCSLLYNISSFVTLLWYLTPSILHK